ncbi:ethanolamine utilization protein EutJ, partial [Salmonella enterica]|nr:ethanolamine utilization protein EutJ [Salmonella enterica]
MRAGGCVSHCIRDDSWRTTNNSGSPQDCKKRR